MYYNGVLLVGKRNHMLTECKICAGASHVVLLIPKSLPDLHLAERTSPGVASHSCFPIIFPTSVNGNSIPPGIQAKDFRVILDSFTSHIQFISKSFCFTFNFIWNQTTVYPWTMRVWTAQIHLNVDFSNKYTGKFRDVLHLEKTLCFLYLTLL